MEKSRSGKIEEMEGDLFDAPDGAALIHACNCQGCWSAGIARAFRTKASEWLKYPAAYAIYKAHCEKLMKSSKSSTVPSTSSGVSGGSNQSTGNPLSPEGTALIIPPQERDYRASSSTKKHWIICLFTSRNFGRKASPPDVILANTELAVADMKRQLEELWLDESVILPVSGLWSCRFNSGLFRVDWGLSRKVLENAGLDVVVVRPEGEE
ncbi:ADP-ribose 1''-phosphate phosphatase [Aspergillus steynii IBT 23096]|uniref:ADP-ribose 1''-phosphate phosphatase n=1 Tax=Aspergillus steynii IBT 23096 TaxID=1392250 RepID=A0A2I2FVL5_9EURO|nr:ADP-ribose 1''-phosphate phosphatase [Aspergillus steynii IBT 23096]PLB44616.1 ADP-ribose 1''-phosphate phosphatase [Aspergillus steynii IBT 23096]